MRGLVLLLLFVAFAVAHPCEKVSNSTQCEWYDDSDIAVFVDGLSDMKLEPIFVDGKLVTYQACFQPLISKFCVNVEVDPWGDFFSNVTLSITVDRITVWSTNTTLPQLMEPNGGLCLDDDTVLEILAMIPGLHDSIKIIMAILEATGCEPRGLFSMCFYFDPCDGAAPSDPMCGCFEFDVQLLYWRRYCLYKYRTNVGCVGTQ